MRSVERQARELDWTQSTGVTTSGRYASGAQDMGPTGRDPLDVDGSEGSASRAEGRKLGPGPASSVVSRLFSTDYSPLVPPSSPLLRSEIPETPAPALAPVPVSAPSPVSVHVPVNISFAVSDQSGSDGKENLCVPGDDYSPGADVGPDCSKNAVEERAISTPAQPSTPLVESMLMSLGFCRVLTKVALRENDGSATRAADWLLTLEESTVDASTVQASSDNDTVHIGRLYDSIAKLEAEVSCRDEAEDALSTLHAYVVNVLKHPDTSRFRSINSANAACRRLCRFLEGQNILRALGFFLQDDGRWELHSSADLARMWLAKTVLLNGIIRICHQ
jgi:PUB domain